MRRVLLIFSLLLAVPSLSHGHPAPFSFVDFELQDTAITVNVVAHAWDVAHELGIEPPERVLDEALLRSGAEHLENIFRERLRLTTDGRQVVLEQWSIGEPLRERQAVRFQSTLSIDSVPGVVDLSADLFPYDPQHQTFLNVYEGDVLVSQAILGESQQDYQYFVGNRQGRWAVIKKFIPAGIHHILIGPDHLLFLIGLLLLGGTVRQLLLVVTGFTIAHSVTLSLAVLDFVTPPGRIVEPVIALSIVYVGVDNLMARGGRDVRVWIAGIFGLIHGFGFASVLREMGLPTGALGWSLFSFNLGVEIGQLAVAIAAASALMLLKVKSVVASQRVAVAGSICVVIVGLYWFVERVFLDPL